MTFSIPALDTLTVEQVARGLDDGSFTVPDLVQAHLARIDALNPTLRAVLQVNSNAMSIAASLQDELRGSGRRGPLHGVPILVKDNIVTNEPLEATSGSLALLGCRPARESPVVTKLREAGAVILGTSNLSEWANFRSRPSDSGWSARGGQTFGAYHEKQNPSGSSSGSGVGVDTGLCVLALGTETSGSIISPSTINNIVGIKPTTGLVSRDAVIPISQEQDTVGPMARSVHDAAVMLSVIAGKDTNDIKTESIPFAQTPDYGAACRQKDISSLRIGVPRNSVAKVEESTVIEDFNKAVDKLRRLVGELVEFDLTGQDKYDEMTSEEKTDAMAGDFKIAIADYLGKLSNNPHNLQIIEDISEFTKNTAGEEYPERNIDRFEQTARCHFDSAEYQAARVTRAYLAGEGGFTAALAKHSLDAIIAPTKASINYFAACGGFPQITLPLGYQPTSTEVKRSDTGNLVDDGPNVPYGISVVGGAYSEVILLRVATVLEDLTRARAKAGEKRLEPYR